jgi:hypothetical protein
LVRSQQDNAFGQGTKENNSTVTVVNGSIPPNKSDLTVFYEASQQVGGYTTDCGTAPSPCAHTLIYLAWERSNVLGSANMDFEINKNSNGCPSVAGTCTINRSTGDILVTYDFTNGGGTPSIGLKTWSGSWQTDNTVVAESAINSGTVTDSVGQGSTSLGSLDANEFGEASIDLTASGLIGSGSCDFGSATTFLKSRSASFTSEIKDFVSPVSTPLTSCASITIIKRTLDASAQRSGDSHSFSYTHTGTGLSDFSLADATGSDVTCTGSNTCNKKVFSGLTPGSGYSVTEGDPSPNYALTDLSCTPSGTGTTASGDKTTRVSTITLGSGGSVTCIYTNQQQTGAIRVTKVSSKKDAHGNNLPLGGAQFTYALLTNGTPGTATNFPNLSSASDGTTCVDGLAFGSYRIAESSAPTGYSKDAGHQDVTVNAAGTCSGSGTVATPTNSFVDTPLTTIVVTATGEASPAGTTKSTISCVDSGGNSVGTDVTTPVDPASDTAAHLAPDTYSCTVVVDP